MWLAKVYVTLKPVVNDPQGLAIQGGLRTLGYSIVRGVRAGKYLEVRLDDVERTVVEEAVREMCSKLLANPVIEDFKFDLEHVP
ncbi:MAG: phosphoribosylformylglycinamidine synthase subunit PurS [Chloroflexi bacterium]|nr:phosphoribosylformylglycinamidine synthase subunit PurS [Chloroflexota bacterium]